jgi:glycosyltransferase involved in cell wall biosynthesis
LGQSVRILGRFADVGLVLSEHQTHASAGEFDYSITPPAREVDLQPANELRWISDPDGHPFDGWWTDDAQDALQTALEEFDPDVVVLVQPFMGSALTLLKRSRAKLVLDSHNVEAAVFRALVERATGGIGNGPKFAELFLDRLVKMEALVTKSVDQLWVCSSSDATLLEQSYSPPGAIRIVPNAVDIADSNDSVGGSASPSPVLLYPAWFAYLPNQQAAHWLIASLLPLLVARDGDVQLILAGSDPPQDLVNAATSHKQVEVIGHVADMSPYFDHATVMPVPLVDGGGTRIKVLQAFAVGVPVVGTAKAVEGLSVEDGVHYVNAESVDEFAEAIWMLHENRVYREKLCAAARFLVESCYSYSALEEIYSNSLSLLLS